MRKRTAHVGHVLQSVDTNKEADYYDKHHFQVSSGVLFRYPRYFAAIFRHDIEVLVNIEGMSSIISTYFGLVAMNHVLDLLHVSADAIPALSELR